MGDKFQPPPWAAAPACTAWLEERPAGAAADSPPLRTLRLDAARWTTAGGAPDGDAHIHLPDAPPAALHAAFVHHPSGKLYLIELAGAAGGTLVDSLRLERHRPLQVKAGFRRAGVVRCAACARRHWRAAS